MLPSQAHNFEIDEEESLVERTGEEEEVLEGGSQRSEGVLRVDLEDRDSRFRYEMPELEELNFDLEISKPKGFAVRSWSFVLSFNNLFLLIIFSSLFYTNLKLKKVCLDLLPMFMFELEKNYRLKIVEILRAHDTEEHYSLDIKLVDLLHSNPKLFNLVLNYPTLCLPLLDEALYLLLLSLEQMSLPEDPLFPKRKIHARVTDLPQLSTYFRTAIPTSSDVGRLVSLSATVTRAGQKRMVESLRHFQCTKCGGSFSIKSNVDCSCAIAKPLICLGDTDPACVGKKFKQVEDQNLISSNYREYQEIKVQEQVNKLSLGTIPRSIIVVLEDDLVDKAKSGDDVIVTGVIRRRWRPCTEGERCQIELYLLACHVHIRNDEVGGKLFTRDQCKEFEEFWDQYAHKPLEGRKIILSSFSPKIYGLYLVKLAVMLSLIGGVQKISSTGGQVRGEPHLLLVGDPGTGKSQFLKAAVKLIPRSVLTTGIGSSSAGLTVTAVRDKGEWMLEPGALVLADRGLCCIDEFDSIRESDKVAILEAMEQQTISIAKAGIVCKLNSRCSVLAATNPKGKYDPKESLSVNLALASPLLSRFDLILVLLDTQNQAWDEKISTFILQAEYIDKSNPDESVISLNSDDLDLADDVWNTEKLKAYIAYTKASFTPRLSPECERVLMKYYQLQRNTDSRSAARTTLRLLESLIRLSQAHARLMCRHIVTVQDAIEVILLMEYSMMGSGSSLASGLNDTVRNGTLQTTCPIHPDQNYLQQEILVLKKLGLTDLISHGGPASRPPPTSPSAHPSDSSLPAADTSIRQSTPTSQSHYVHPYLRLPKKPKLNR